jgi:hypothetical protein
MISILFALQFATTSPEMSQVEVSTERLVKQSIIRYGYLYGVSTSTLDHVLRCESFYGKYQLNEKEVHGKSLGVAQFRQSTFDYYSKKAGIENADVWDVEDSVETLAYMIKTGKGNHFSCYRKLK